MRKFMTRHLITMLCASGILSLSNDIFASAFQLTDQDITNLATAHAGYAALADNASIAFYNPAGITRFKNQQLVVAGLAAMPTIKYEGSVAVNTINDSQPYPVTAQGGKFALVPALHYVAPLSDKIGFGFSVDAPFGMQINYGRSTFLRYVSTFVSVKVIDISPVLAFQLTDKASVGLGPDFQKMTAEFDEVAVAGDPTLGDSSDTDSNNRADDTGWGFHAGAMYEFTPNTRIGLSYHSQVVHHLSRKSTFSGPLADEINQAPIISRARANITLPPYTALSIFQRINPQFAIMGSAIYTQWSSVRNLIIKNVAGIDLATVEPNPNITVIIPQFFHNSWSVSVAGDYYVTDQITLRAGLGFDETPVQDAYRTVQLPDNNRYIVALGGHYQANKAVGIDIGWSHFFLNKAHIAPPTQITGDQETITNGSVKGGADALGAQVVWDIV